MSLTWQIIYQDDYLLAVNKPAGLSVIPEGWQSKASCLRAEVEAALGPVWVIHRIDKTTSGLVIFARDAQTHRFLNQAFAAHQVRKGYLALLNGRPPRDTLIAKHPLRINVGRKHRTVPSANGKPSVTEFHILSRAETFSLAEVWPHSGRTHQIRAHAAALGYPLLGDQLYGAPETTLITRPALHARWLEIPHPARAAALRLESPLPADFKSLIANLPFKF